MRKIICLRADDGGGYQATYRVGETAANGTLAVEKIIVRPARTSRVDALKSGDIRETTPCHAAITFDTGLTRMVPEHRIISWDLGPEESS